jgi:hypothetical protein
MAETPLSVRAGAIVALRLFDIAYAIDLRAAETVWTARTAKASARSQLSRAPEKALSFDVPPLLLTLDPVTFDVGGTPRVFTAAVRLYDFGVAALSLRLPVCDLSWADYTSLVNQVDQVLGPVSGAPIWEHLLTQIREPLQSALSRPSPTQMVEDYLLSIVHRWSEPVIAAALESRIDLVPLLSGEHLRLSPQARGELLRQRFSYYEDDLVVLTWDRAFICEPREDTDVADVLEVANAQLLELRYYDELLDTELPRMYDLVEEAQRIRHVLASRRFAGLARRLYTLVAEVTEVREKIDNALQVTEDVYLARIYTAALELYRVPTVGAAVDRKLAIMRDTYTALYDEASSARAEVLEVAIVILIVVEIILAFIKH